MQATVQLKSETALELQAMEQQPRKRRARSAATRKLLKTVADLGVEIRPQFPGQTHPLLTPFFLIDLSDEETAEQVLTQLRKLDAVEAAYLAPPAEPPSSVEF